MKFKGFKDGQLVGEFDLKEIFKMTELSASAVRHNLRCGREVAGITFAEIAEEKVPNRHNAEFWKEWDKVVEDLRPLIKGKNIILSVKSE